MHGCLLELGQTGRCRARRDEHGRIISINYGKLTSIALDPIEKKPLAMFCPGSMILSVGSFGCNMDCQFCQNDSISMASENEITTRYVAPDELAEYASQLRQKGNIGIAYTYNEPMIGFEYVRDTASIAHRQGMKNVVVTNGAVSLPVLDEVLPYIDAYNIDLKGITETYYKKLGGDLKTVQRFIIKAVAHAHVELTTLIVPDENDSVDEIAELSSWVASVDEKIPLHITRFFPRRKMLDKEPTDIALLYKLWNVAKKSLQNVFVGNV